MVKKYIEFKNDNNLYLNIIKSRKKDKKQYFENPNCFDIEVTNYKEPYNEDIKAGIVYFWTFAITDKIVYYGRTIEDFKEFIEVYYEAIKKYEAIQVIYIHNFAYEFQFLRKVLDWEKVFLIDNRKPLYASYKCFEFRCSYLLSNMSLNNFLKNYGCDIQKLNYDYNKNRYPWTKLSEQEIQYCVNDTTGLYQAIKNLLNKDNKDITNIPLTSTAYVRQEVKRAQSGAVRNKIKQLSNIDPDLYIALKSAFVGGNTHANRLYANHIIDNVHCYDITSSYPYAQMCELYPITPFRRKEKGLNDLVLDDNFAYLLLAELYNVELKDYLDGMPVISKSKCIEAVNIDIDNGRILSADYLQIWLTDIEFNIIKEHYDFDVKFIKCFYSRYGEIPESIKSVIYSYFENKCTLKGVDDYLYMKSKNKLNSIYGMSAFDIGKQRYNYKGGEYLQDDREVKEILEDYLESTTSAEPYSFGVWTTAHARKNLDNMTRFIGDRFIYCDTDSVYMFGELENLDYINNEIKMKSEKYKVTYKNNDYYLGVWKHDKICNQFITLGAKKYCYTDANGVHTVTAGVSKSAGVESINDYKIGHVFKNATNNAWYIDDDLALNIDNHLLNIPSSIYIESSDYTLGVTEEYRKLLLMAKEIDIMNFAQ